MALLQHPHHVDLNVLGNVNSFLYQVKPSIDHVGRLIAIPFRGGQGRFPSSQASRRQVHWQLIFNFHSMIVTPPTSLISFKTYDRVNLQEVLVTPHHKAEETSISCTLCSYVYRV